MSFPNDIDPYNFFRQFFGGSGGRRRREGRGFGGDGILMIYLENLMI